MVISFDDAAAFLPKYLAPESRKELFAEIRNFERIRYYARIDDPEPLQGDGWANSAFWDLEAAAERKMPVAVISNSCDIAGENKGKRPGRITISPIIRLARVEALLEKYGANKEQVIQYCKDIRAQEISDIFFLPQGGGVEEDSVIFLDNLQSPLLERFIGIAEARRRYSLSQAGFWLFLVKLAIHFCRAQEDIKRGYA